MTVRFHAIERELTKALVQLKVAFDLVKAESDSRISGITADADVTYARRALAKALADVLGVRQILCNPPIEEQK